MRFNSCTRLDWTRTFNDRMLAEAGVGTANVGGANGQNGNLIVPNISVGGVSEGITSGGWGREGTKAPCTTGAGF